MADLVMQQRDDCVQLVGDINYQTILKALSLNLFPTKEAPDEKIRVDFSGVNNTDSAALALMIHWLRAAREREMDIQFLNIPSKLIALAEMSNLETVLPLS